MQQEGAQSFTKSWQRLDRLHRRQARRRDRRRTRPDRAFDLAGESKDAARLNASCRRARSFRSANAPAPASNSPAPPSTDVQRQAERERRAADEAAYRQPARPLPLTRGERQRAGIRDRVIGQHRERAETDRVADVRERGDRRHDRADDELGAMRHAVARMHGIEEFGEVAIRRHRERGAADADEQREQHAQATPLLRRRERPATARPSDPIRLAATSGAGACANAAAPTASSALTATAA